MSIYRNCIIYSEDTSHSEYVTADEDENAVDDGINQDPIVKRTSRGKSEVTHTKNSEHFSASNSSSVAQENNGAISNLNAAPSPGGVNAAPSPGGVNAVLSPGGVSVTSGVTYIVSSDSLNATR